MYLNSLCFGGGRLAARKQIKGQKDLFLNSNAQRECPWAFGVDYELLMHITQKQDINHQNHYGNEANIYYQR